MHAEQIYSRYLVCLPCKFSLQYDIVKVIFQKLISNEGGAVENF